MTEKSLLVEIGSEELPPKPLDELAQAFARGIADGLVKRGMTADVANAKTFCSPRRLAAWIPSVAAEQPTQLIERRGPALAAGLDAAGQPTKALLGFAASCGVGVEILTTLETDKGAWFVHCAEKPGKPIAALVPEIVAEAIATLPIPKPMRWGDHDYAFVRPVHWLVLLHGDRVIDAEIFGVRSGRQSRGHRFHHPKSVHVADADSWLDALRAAKVLADPSERRARVRAEIERVGGAQGKPRLRGELLGEIANLTEWPVAIACAFERDFLRVPQEALITTMETNQKFVPVFDASGCLTEHFVGVANIESKQPSEIRKGYERVIRPRFADARFFYDEDLKTPLAAQQQALKNVTYQQALGSVWEKCMRVADLARTTANRVGVDAALAAHAASLSKCDLMTRMVGEFPELQGTMGRYYATANGEHAEIAAALDEFYAPRFAGDGIAKGKVGQVLAVAERLDTLVGIFAVGLKPSGNKDPFALRRSALGLARTLIEGEFDIDLRAAFAEALALLPESALAAGLPKSKDGKLPALDTGARRTALEAELYDFVLDRLRGYYAGRGLEGGPLLLDFIGQQHQPGYYEKLNSDYAGEAFDAVRALAPASLLDFDRRLRAVVSFSRLPEAQALAAANKRIGNILRQAGGEPDTAVDPAAFELDAEAALHAAIEAARADAAPLIDTRRYVELLQRLAQLREPVDRFFDGVMVMADDPARRRNRLALLAQLRAMFLRVADISLLQSAV